MINDNKIVDVTNDVKWVGVLDPDLRTFDIVMETEFGTTYNSYFINAQKKAVVETTKEKYWDVYLAKLKTITNPEEIEYIICNHTEPDHSGNVGNLLKVAPKARVVGSGNTIRYLTDLLGYEFPHIVAKDGYVLDLGNKKIRFIGAANLHWPDSTYAYLEEDKILFTCDSFGSHYCDENIFDDLTGDFDKAFTYYFDVILKPFSKFFLKAIEKIRPLEIAAICTGHGPVLRKNWKKYVDLSEKYSKQALSLIDKPRVFIPYLSAYGNSKTIAYKIAEGVKLAGDVDVVLSDLEKENISNIDSYIAKSSGIIVGSPTINKNTLLQIYQMFAVINPIRDIGKLAAVFGSYGWSGEAVKIIHDNLVNLKLNLFEEDFPVKFTLHEKDYEKCIDFGKRFTSKMLENRKVQNKE
ncbi:MAG TPA: FprA family A-type flavoprotein [Bacteroidales bacterium]|nr:FprA family A-type flavoprotein [Bacteroidales bacterium]HPS18146.1 FprA family A-type flavoprotein [Bacteroidales bacterium]